MNLPHEARSTETVCPYCRAGFEPDEEIKACPACGTPHHADCFAENGGCTVFGCAAAPADDPAIVLTPTDLQVPAYGGNSLYSLNSPLASPPPAGSPPPPRPDGSSPPPPLAYAAAPYPAAYGYPAYAASSYVRPKERVTFVLLAIFLGAFGAHNFYTGYNKKAVIQLCITLLSCFWFAAIAWIWAIVEACTITSDDDGVPLA